MPGHLTFSLSISNPPCFLAIWLSAEFIRLHLSRSWWSPPMPIYMPVWLNVCMSVCVYITRYISISIHTYSSQDPTPSLSYLSSHRQWTVKLNWKQWKPTMKKTNQKSLFSVITFSSSNLWAYKSVYLSGGRCPTPGCDGSGHLTSNFASHRRCDFLFSWWIPSQVLFIVFSLPQLCCQIPIGGISYSKSFRYFHLVIILTLPKKKIRKWKYRQNIIFNEHPYLHVYVISISLQ